MGSEATRTGSGISPGRRALGSIDAPKMVGEGMVRLKTRSGIVLLAGLRGRDHRGAALGPAVPALFRLCDHDGALALRRRGRVGGPGAAPREPVAHGRPRRLPRLGDAAPLDRCGPTGPAASRHAPSRSRRRSRSTRNAWTTCPSVRALIDAPARRAGARRLGNDNQPRRAGR